MIPPFTIDGILPPFVGHDGPGDDARYMTPYAATACEVVARFGGTDKRRDILLGWLNFRSALRSAGIVRGFQWIDGSFVENKEPNDIDVVTYFYRPDFLDDPARLAQRAAWTNSFRFLFRRNFVKWLFKVDSFPIDLKGNPENLVDTARYLGGLFSHRRGDNVWKGMLSVRLEDPADDMAALAAITAAVPAGAVGVRP